MNPPYQELKEGNKKSQALWDKFVIKTVGQLVEGGYLVAVHPSGWRNVDGVFKNVQNLLKSKQLLYLEVHNTDDGIKTFGATTTYDFYCLHNVANTMFTKIKCQDGTIERVGISKLEFIPNGMYKEIFNLIAKEGEERVNVLYSRSAYGTDKKNVSKVQDDEFKYPCAMNINVKNEIGCMYYSNTMNNGHFGETKVIFGVFGTGVFIDSNGEYGLCQHCRGIIDNAKNLPYIKKAMLNPDFIQMIKMCEFGALSGTIFNRKIISLFRKDFWKEFI
jgi:hypothetical protein